MARAVVSKPAVSMVEVWSRISASSRPSPVSGSRAFSIRSSRSSSSPSARGWARRWATMASISRRQSLRKRGRPGVNQA